MPGVSFAFCMRSNASSAGIPERPIPVSILIWTFASTLRRWAIEEIRGISRGETSVIVTFCIIRLASASSRSGPLANPNTD